MWTRILLSIALIEGVSAGIPGSSGANPGEPNSILEAENCGSFTVAPSGGESLVDPIAGNDYRIHVILLDINGNPVVNLPATDFWLEHPELATCPGIFSQSGAPTDANGHTTFSGAIHAGLIGDAQSGVDCDAAFLYSYVQGLILNFGEPVCVSTDSPDLNGDLQVGIADFGAFARDFN